MDEKDTGTVISQIEHSPMYMGWGFLAICISVLNGLRFDSLLVCACLLFVTMTLLAVSTIFNSTAFICSWLNALYGLQALELIYEDNIGVHHLKTQTKVILIMAVVSTLLILFRGVMECFKVIKQRKDTSS